MMGTKVVLQVVPHCPVQRKEFTPLNSTMSEVHQVVSSFDHVEWWVASKNGRIDAETDLDLQTFQADLLESS